MALRLNATYNVIGALLPVAVALVTIPIYLQIIGEARYGVLAIVWLVLGYFGLFDFGIGRATAHGIASDSTQPDAASRWENTFWTALLVNLGLGLAGAVVIVLCAHFLFANVVTITAALRPEVEAATPWLGLALPVATASGVLNGALQGREKFLALNVVSVFGTILFQVLPLAIAAFWSVQLDVLLPAAICARLITVVALMMQCRRHVLRSYKPTYSSARARELFSFGGWIMVTSLIGPMMVVLDRVLIGAIAGTKAVAYYTVPFQLAENSAIVPAALSSALFPRLTYAPREEQQQLSLNATQVIACVMTPLLVGGILFIEPFFFWWISPEFSKESAYLGQILLVGFWVNCFARIPYALLQARGKPDLVAKTHLCEVLPYFALLYLGMTNFGVVGAAWAFCIRVLVDYILLSILAGTFSANARLASVPILFIVLALVTALHFPIKDLYGLPGALLLLALTLVWATFAAPQNLKHYILTAMSIIYGFLSNNARAKDAANEK